MSHYVECQTEFRDPAALVAALVECGFEESQIEVHDQAVSLCGHPATVTCAYRPDDRSKRHKLVKSCCENQLASRCSGKAENQ
jgi:hypothetical protein